MKLKVDEDFFRDWSADMAYILGIITSDGCLLEYKNGYNGIDITSKDISHLRRIKERLKSEHKIGKKERGYRIQIRNKRIYNNLISLGLTPRKSKIIRLPKVPKKYLSHFIRGVFDGDGSVMVWREPRWNHTWQIRASFTSGSQQFLQDLDKQLRLIAGLSGGKVSSVTRGYHLRYVSMPGCLALYKFMYEDNSNLFLKRKRDKFELFSSLKSNEIRNQK